MTRSENILGGGIILTFTFLCIANVLLLPPYEGFDETAHYSYISILADRHAIPDFRHTPMDATVGNDLLGLPLPYTYSGANGGITYSKFFNTGFPLEREKAVRGLWQDPQGVASYVPGRGANWEGQHPPLYYLVMIVPYRLARTWPPGMRLLFLRLFSVALACGSLVFWFKSIKLFRSSSSRRFLLLAGLVITFFPSLWYDLARLGNDSLVALLFAGSFYFLLSTYINGQRHVSDFIGLSLTLGLGLLTKLFFLPLLIGAVLYSLWIGVRVSKIGLRPLLFRVSLLAGGALLLAGWWFWFCYFRYGMAMTSHEAYIFRQIGHPPGDQLTSVQFFVEMTRALGGFVTTFLWCGTWSWVRPPVSLYACFLPPCPLPLWGHTSYIRVQGQTTNNQIVAIAVFFLVPLLLGFVCHMYLRVKFTGVGKGTEGYYLFAVWPIIGLCFVFSFEAKETIAQKIALLSAFALVSFFDAAGWWRSALVYSGLVEVEKAGLRLSSRGFVLPTIGNIALVLDRLRTLAFPHGAMLLYVMALLVRSALAVGTIFFLSSPFEMLSPEINEPSQGRKVKNAASLTNQSYGT